MKKLMTMLAAAAMAFGLYADDAKYEQKETFDEGFTVSGLWVTNAADTATVEVQDYLTGDEPTHVPDAFNGNVGETYLAVKTGMKLDGSNGLAYNFGAQDKSFATEDVYFDGLVNFATACDETNVEVTVDGDIKLVAYAVDMFGVTENDADIGKTNLFITAGFWNGASWEPKAYNCGQLQFYDMSKDFSGFYRLTIRAMGNIGNSGTVPGFVVFVNGQPAQRLDPADGIGYTDLNPTAAAWNSTSNRNLFPSLNQDAGSGAALTTIAGVTVAGQGLIDCFALTRNRPACTEDKSFTLAIGEHVTSLSYKVDGGSVETLTSGSASIPYVEGMKVEVTAVTYEAGTDPQYDRGTWMIGPDENHLEPIADNVNTFEPADANMIGIVNGKDVTPRIMVDSVGYPTFKDAIAALKTAEVKTLTLNKNVTVNKDGTKTEACFDATTDVKIDLNGKTITGAADNTGFVLMTYGKLYVTDTSTGKNGRIVAVTGNKGVISAISTDLSTVASVKIDAGFYDGTVTIDPGEDGIAAASTADLRGGSFKSADGSAFYLEDYLADGFEAKYDDVTYWTVSEIPGNTLKVTPNEKATFVLTVGDDEYTDETMPTDGIEVKPGVTYELVATAAEYYEYDGEETTTISGTMPNDALTLVVPAPTAKVFTAAYLEWDESTPVAGIDDSFKTFTVENASSMNLPTPTKDGYEFVAWYASTEEGEEPVGNEIFVDTIEAGDDGFTVYAKWNEVQKDATVTLNYSDTEIASVTVKVGEEDPKTITEKTFEAAIGSTIVITATAQTGYENVMYKVGEDDAADSCEFTLGDDTEVKISATLKPQPVNPDEPQPSENPEADAKKFNDMTPAQKAEVIANPGIDSTLMADYAGKFEAVANTSEGTVTIQLKSTAKQALEDQAADDTKDIDLSKAATEGGKQSIEATPGFFYSVIANSSLDGMKVRSCQVAKGTTVEVDIPHYENSGFYTIKASVKAQEVEADFVEDK